MVVQAIVQESVCPVTYAEPEQALFVGSTNPEDRTDVPRRAEVV